MQFAKERINKQIIFDNSELFLSSQFECNQKNNSVLSPINQDVQSSFQNKLPSFLQANPILDSNRHYPQQKGRVGLKFINQLEVNNKTSYMAGFQHIRKQSLSFGKCEPLINRIQIINSQQYTKNNERDLQCQFFALLQGKIYVYRRIDNKTLNQIGPNKQRIYASIFFNFKKKKNMSKQKPIHQYLSQIFKLRNEIIMNDILIFDSRFESGNLFSCIKTEETDIPTYELYIQNDTNTKGCTQWFYFSTINRIRTKVKFRLMNFYKPTSLFQKGMKILYSDNANQWKRTGISISYSRCSILQNQDIYTLEFIHDFDQLSKQTYFCYGYPYNYTFHLKSFLEGLTENHHYKKLLKKSLLCTSAMGNQIYQLLITNQTIKQQKKPIIYIIARQHPGETPASFVVEGLINFLLSNLTEAKQLRDKYELRIVPMVNVDGVISGNYRSNISGKDLNRQWQQPSKTLQPEIYWLKQQIMKDKQNISFFLDIHAHSRKMNSFFYGSYSDNHQNKFFPFVCSRLNKFISYNDSSFSDDIYKQNTARVVLEKQLNIPYSLTYQVSFYGWVNPQKKMIQTFKQIDYKNMGSSLGLGLYYSFIGIAKVKFKNQEKLIEQNINQKSENLKSISEKQLALQKNSKKLLEKWLKQHQKQIYDCENSISQGSSLDPQHFQLKQEELLRIQNSLQIMSIQNQKDNDIKKDAKPSIKTLRAVLDSSPKRKVNLVKNEMIPAINNPLKRERQPRTEREFYHFSSAKYQKKQPFNLREIDLQLQIKESKKQSKLKGNRLKISNLYLCDRYSSLDTHQQKRYKNQVSEIKTALKYLIDTSSHNKYEQYKSHFKNYNKDALMTLHESFYHQAIRKKDNQKQWFQITK